MSYWKRVFSVTNPLRWYYYLFYSIVFFVAVLTVSALICWLVYCFKGILEYTFEKQTIQTSFISNKGFLSLYGLIVTMVATMTGLIGPALAVYWSFRQDNRTVIDLTYSLVKEWRETTITNAAQNITEYFERHNNSNDSLYNLYTFTTLEENKELRLSVKIVLNYLEAVAAACNSNHVDNKLIRKYFEALVTSYYKRLTPYINDVRNKRQHAIIEDHLRQSLYQEFTNLAAEWQSTSREFNMQT